MVKPFSPIELVARVKAHIQIHRSLKEEKNEKGKKIQAGGITICPASYRAYKDGRELEPVSYTHLDVYKRQAYRRSW